MSYCYFHGIIPVSAGRRVQTVRGNGSVVWHTVYDSMFYTESREVVDGVFRTFSPASESLLPDNSLLIANGKFAFPFLFDGSDDTSSFMIDSMHFNLFVLDTAQENYDSFLPVDDVPSITLLGNVIGSMVQMGDGAKAVDVRVNVYISGKMMDCIIRCVLFLLAYRLLICFRCRFPPSPRWAKLNMPIAGSVIMIFGRPYSITSGNNSNLLIVTVEDIVYNPGSMHILAESKSDASASPRRLQVRKKLKPTSTSGSNFCMTYIRSFLYLFCSF